MSGAIVQKLTASRRDLRIEGARRGKIVAIGSDGRVFVEYPDCGEPIAAAVAGSVVRDGKSLVDSTVLLLFENGDPALPVVVDTLHERVEVASDTMNVEAPRQDELRIDGKRLALSAEEEVVIRCGDSTLTMTADGKVVIRGRNLVSRSSGLNRIKGGSVQIN